MSQSFTMQLFFATSLCLIVASTIGCHRNRVLSTAKMAVVVDGRQILDQNDLVEIQEVKAFEYDGFQDPPSDMKVRLSFSKAAKATLKHETKSNIGKLLEVFVDGKLLFSEPITSATDRVELDFRHGSKAIWMQYFFGKGDIDV